MISNMKFAASVLEEASTSFERLNDLLSAAREILSDQEIRELRNVVGKALAVASIEALGRESGQSRQLRRRLDCEFAECLHHRCRPSFLKVGDKVVCRDFGIIN